MDTTIEHSRSSNLSVAAPPIYLAGLMNTVTGQTGPGDCLHQCGLKTTVLDWCNSSDIYTWTTTRRRPQPFFRVVWLLVALMHAGYGRLTSAPEQRMSWPCLDWEHLGVTTAMGSGTIKKSVPSVLPSLRMSSKNIKKI
jgi:hypothetical protein